MTAAKKKNSRRKQARFRSSRRKRIRNTVLLLLLLVVLGGTGIGAIYVLRNGTVFDKLAKLENQEIENDDPPVFVVDTAFQLFFQRHLLFLYIQIDGFLCNTLSGKIIFQHTAKCTYKAKNYGNNPPV